MKNVIFYSYTVIMILLAIYVANPILDSPSHRIFTYFIMAFFPLFIIVRKLVNDKYEDLLNYLCGIFY